METQCVAPLVRELPPGPDSECQSSGFGDRAHGESVVHELSGTGDSGGGEELVRDRPEHRRRRLNPRRTIHALWNENKVVNFRFTETIGFQRVGFRLAQVLAALTVRFGGGGRNRTASLLRSNPHNPHANQSTTLVPQ